jgi:HAD superfamily hydrolase (TIGR01509 family)
MPVLPRPEHVSATLFDMDGLLIDSEPLWFAVECDLARSLGAEWTHADWLLCVGRGLPNTVRRLADKAGVALDVAEGVALLRQRFVLRLPDLALKPGAPEALAAARSVGRVALATSNTRPLAEAVLARFGLAGAFDAVLTGESVARHKPAPDVFVEAARVLDVPIGACVVLEDSLPGVQAGRAAGAFVVGVPDTHTDREALAAEAHLTLVSLAHVADWLAPHA